MEMTADSTGLNLCFFFSTSVTMHTVLCAILFGMLCYGHLSLSLLLSDSFGTCVGGGVQLR